MLRISRKTQKDFSDLAGDAVCTTMNSSIFCIVCNSFDLIKKKYYVAMREKCSKLATHESEGSIP
jgi:hypothetical protein